MTYDTHGLRTRFGVCWLLGMLGVPAMALAIQRWANTGTLVDGLAVLWVTSVAIVTIRLLVTLGRLEASGPQPDRAMTLAFEAITVIPILGLVPLLAAAVNR